MIFSCQHDKLQASCRLPQDSSEYHCDSECELALSTINIPTIRQIEQAVIQHRLRTFLTKKITTLIKYAA